MKFSAFIHALGKKWWVRQIDKIVFLIFLLIIFLVYPGQNILVTKQFRIPKTVSFPFFSTPSPAPYPVNKTGTSPENLVSATSVVVQDVTSGVYLYRKDSTTKLPPASTTKILTALVVLDSMPLDEVVTVQRVVNMGAVIGLVENEQITVENLLYGMLIQSGNDAGYALAQHYPGGVDAFVLAMNKKAQDLHMSGSHFVNPVGFDDPGQYMTAEDLARLGAYALTNKIFSKMVGIPAITISDVTHTYFHKLSNVNQLLGKIPGIAGIKTGWTEEAGENLVTLMERNGRKIIIVVLHSKDRFGDTMQLINWVFGNFEWQEFKAP